MGSDLPKTIPDVTALEELLSEPTTAVIELMRQLDGDILILGASGKIGPSLARMARRASDSAGVSRRVIAVSRFSNHEVESDLKRQGVETHRADLSNPRDVAALPNAENIVFLVGRKFGTAGSEPLTWVTNVSIPTLVCERFPGRCVVAVSTLCVYPYVSPASGGSKESDSASPFGEYAMSTLGRERVFEHFCRMNDSPTAILRLTYSVEMRYGVLVDIANWVWNEQPVCLETGFVNILWQGDVNARILCALSHTKCPARILNVAGPEILAVRDLAVRFGERMKKTPRFLGEPAGDAWLPCPTECSRLLGPPRVDVERLIDWTADWIQHGVPSLDKPTRFEVRDGIF